MTPDNQSSPDPIRLDDHTIEEMAADWIAWRDTGLSAQQATEFARWRSADPRHDDAIRRLEATQTLLARLPETPDAGAMYAEIDALCANHRQRVWRKTWARATIGLAAAAAIALVLWLPQRAERAEIYRTTEDARPSIDLADGSTLALGANSEVRVEFHRHERRLDLAWGEAHFAVAKDAARPFVVTVGAVTVEAIGTAFTVRRTEADVDVLVTEGEVVVRRSGAAVAATAVVPLHLVAGERARISVLRAVTDDNGVDAFEVSKGTVEDPAHLVFADTPLAEAVDRFNRHSRVQMEIADPELRAKTLGGTFNAGNAEAFINLLRASGEISVERVSETHVVLRAVRPAQP